MRKLEGIIVSDKMRRTAVVRVDRLARHPKYLKHYRVSRKFKADTAGAECRIGDVVVMEETRPLSKGKRWRIIEVVKKAKAAELVEEFQEGKTENEK